MMNGSGDRNVIVLAVLVATIFLAAGSIRAQDNAAYKIIASTVSQLPRNDEATRGDLPLALELTNGSLLTEVFVDQADETLGATLRPVSDALRAQLDIPTGQGLLVASLNGDSPSARAGLMQNDVLLMLADKPLAVTDDLTKQLKAAGESPVLLKVLRAGKPIEIQVRPIYRVTLGPVEEQKTEYFIGVSIGPADDALRAQLELPASQGVIVNQVSKGSPAEKAGVKKHDIILELDGKAIDSAEALTRHVATLKDRPGTLKLLRAGKSLTLPVTAELRKVEGSPIELKLRYMTLAESKMPGAMLNLVGPRGSMSSVELPATEDVRQRLNHLEKELKDVHQALNRLNQALKTDKSKKGE
jgi:membrane-associated protease RseP (regulator of RpoE activity)